MQKDIINSSKINDLISPSQLINTSDLVEKLGISRRNFYLIRKNIETFIPPIRIGKRSIRYKLSDVLNFIERGGLNAH